MPGIVDTMTLGAAVGRAKVQCIFVHGRNQSPEEMEVAVIRHLSTPDIAFHLPRAGGKCWYHGLAVDPRSDATNAELAQSLADLAAIVRLVRALGQPVLLGGFSQGACLSLEHAFSGQDSADAVVAFTGCRVGVPGDARPDSLTEGLPVYLTAGRADPWIPLQAFADAAVALGQGGARLRADVFPARGHAVSLAEIAMLDAMLADLAAGRSPAMGAAR
ncbi:MAG: dienelactone hydrolase family protein [Rhodobacteraceae bacterium]|jgi:phospholipase/carboxylesterase|nr:dienelactone hydrolase family protein [Paracoccaceae bacterium]